MKLGSPHLWAVCYALLYIVVCCIPLQFFLIATRIFWFASLTALPLYDISGSAILAVVPVVVYLLAIAIGLFFSYREKYLPMCIWMSVDFLFSISYTFAVFSENELNILGQISVGGFTFLQMLFFILFILSSIQKKPTGTPAAPQTAVELPEETCYTDN